MSAGHFRITQASLIAAFTFIVGQVVAFVPAFGPEKQDLISAGTAVITAVWLVANAIHKLADSNVSAKDVEAGAITAAKTELGKVDFDALVKDAVDAKSLPDIEQRVQALVEAKVAAILSGGLKLQPQPATQTPVAPPAV